MIIKFNNEDIKKIVQTYIDELVYGVADMDVDITVSNDTEVVCWIDLKEQK